MTAKEWLILAGVVAGLSVAGIFAYQHHQHKTETTAMVQADQDRSTGDKAKVEAKKADDQVKVSQARVKNTAPTLKADDDTVAQRRATAEQAFHPATSGESKEPATDWKAVAETQIALNEALTKEVADLKQSGADKDQLILDLTTARDYWKQSSEAYEKEAVGLRIAHEAAAKANRLAELKGGAEGAALMFLLKTIVH